MINEFSANPKPQNKSAHTACAALMALFAVTAVAYTIIDRYRGIVGLVSIIFLTAGIYIYTKYISVKYYYDITKDSEGKGLFIVRREVGKRQSTLYVTRLSNISDVKLLKREDARGENADRSFSRHSFKVTLLPPVICLVRVQSRLEKAILTIECTQELANLLLGYAKDEKEKAALEEEKY